MYYLVYKTTNLINGMIYIGQHATENLNDGYLGSGRHLQYAIRKYGRKNFVRELLYCADTWAKMNEMEVTLVTPEFMARKDTYNHRTGGNLRGDSIMYSAETRKAMSDAWDADRKAVLAARSRSRIDTPETTQKKRQVWTPENRAELSRKISEHCSKPEVRAARSERSKLDFHTRAPQLRAGAAKWQSENKAILAERVSGAKNPMYGRGAEIAARRAQPEVRAQHAEISKKLWEDPAYVQHIKEANAKPEVKEKRLKAVRCGARTDNKSGVCGVSWFKASQKWRADITVAGKATYLGSYLTLDEAIAARKAAELRYFGEFAPTATTQGVTA